MLDNTYKTGYRRHTPSSVFPWVERVERVSADRLPSTDDLGEMVPTPRDCADGERL
jgi:hypothetical protein